MERKTEVSQFLKKIFRLPLLPPAEVGDCFALDFIIQSTERWAMEQFCDYLLENDIDEDSTFPPPVWYECSASSFQAAKTCESFHVHFNALFYSAHPNTFVLASTLQQTQNETCIKMREVTTRRLRTSGGGEREEEAFIPGRKKSIFVVLTRFRESDLFHQGRRNSTTKQRLLFLYRLHLRCHLPPLHLCLSLVKENTHYTW
jgi:hypothetical protein